MPRFVAGRDAVSVNLNEWWDRNWWLVTFWVLELVVLFAFLAWSHRRRSRRSRQLDSVVTGLARVMPADWEPERDLQVLRWSGHRPIRVRLLLTPRSSLEDPRWRQSVADAARRVLGPLEPITWPQPARSGVFDWGRRPPRVELKVHSTTSRGDQVPILGSESKLSPNSAMVSRRSQPPDEDLQIYHRPRPHAPGRLPAEQGSAPTRLDRED